MAQNKTQARIKRKARVRKKVSGNASRPRLSVFRSLNHIYVQVIDDAAGHTVAFASSREAGVSGDKTEKAKAVGEAVAKRCLEKGVKTVVFDRGGYKYHGRVQAIAEAARSTGLEF